MSITTGLIEFYEQKECYTKNMNQLLLGDGILVGIYSALNSVVQKIFMLAIFDVKLLPIYKLVAVVSSLLLNLLVGVFLLQCMNRLLALYPQLIAVPTIQSQIILQQIFVSGIMLNEFMFYSPIQFAWIGGGAIVCFSGLYFKLIVGAKE